jgi:hypothetical protein
MNSWAAAQAEGYGIRREGHIQTISQTFRDAHSSELQAGAPKKKPGRFEPGGGVCKCEHCHPKPELPYK